jgi:tetratricopeptide (TPR) repeat protein
MAATSTRPTPHRRSRAVAFLAAAVVVMVAGYVIDRTGAFRTEAWTNSVSGRSSTPLPSAAASAGVGPLADLAPISVPDGARIETDASLAALHKAIGVWSANLGRDDADFVSAQNLALDYYTLGRLTGDIDDYARAQAAVAQGLKAFPTDTGGLTMAALLQYTLHDFAGARAAARAVYDADHRQLQALATAGDSELELGDYAAAAATFATLDEVQPGAAITARLAHLASLRGHDAEATSLAAQAGKEARAEGAGGTSLAYYDYLQGFLAFQVGSLTSAAAAYTAALKDWPGSYLALEGLAKVRAAQGQTTEAISLYGQAIAIVPQPEYLAGLGDLYQLSGQPKLADQQYRTVRVIARLQALQPKVYNRQLVLFDANHGEDLTRAVSLAESELAVRKDVYGWDAYAWALFAAGRAGEADAAMVHALALGTHDAVLLYHAGMIAHGVADDPRARTLLEQALKLNPGFDPLQAARAQQVLASLP